MDLLPTIPTKDELAVLTDLARTLHGTGMFPKALDTPGKLMAVLLRGRELGLGPMASLAGINIVEGKASLSAEMMLALVRRAGHRVEFLEKTDRRCTVKGHRGDQVMEMTYTWEDAAKFRKKEHDKWMPATETFNYRGHPAAMLRARAISALCRCLYSDVTLGLVTPDEAEEIAASEARDVEVRDVTPKPDYSSQPEAMLRSRAVESAAEQILAQRTGLKIGTTGPDITVRSSPQAPEVPAVSEAAAMLAPLTGPTGTTDAEETAPVRAVDPPEHPAEKQPDAKPEPRGTLFEDAPSLRAKIRNLLGELGPGALLDAKAAAGVVPPATATATPDQLARMLSYLEERAEMAAYDRQQQEAEANAQDEVMA